MPDRDPSLPFTSSRPLDWLLADLLPKIPGAKAALLLSSDGIAKAAAGLDDENANLLSATASGLFSLAHSANKHTRDNTRAAAETGGVRQVMAELDDMLLFLRRAGEHTVLALVTSHDADPKHVGAQMAQLIESVEPHLETPLRSPAAGAGESMT